MAHPVALIGIGEAIYDHIVHGQSNLSLETGRIISLCCIVIVYFIRRDGLYDVDMVQRLVWQIAISVFYLVTTAFLSRICPSGQVISIEQGTFCGITLYKIRNVMPVFGIACYLFYIAINSIRLRPALKRLKARSMRYESRVWTVTTRVVVLLFKVGLQLVRLVLSIMPRRAGDSQKKEQSYIHTPLEPGQIRILTIHRRLPFFPLRSTVTITTLESAPSYEAISYTWGTTSDVRRMYVNSHPFETSKATHDALCSRSSMWRSRTVWIDYLCVNQQDLEEKSIQVVRMTEIYREAACVIVYLGGSVKAFLAILAMHQLLFWEHNKQSDAEMTRFFGRQTLTVFWRAFEELLNHPWFSRVWVIQEVAVAKRVCVAYGGLSHEWNSFVQLLNIFSSPGMSVLLQSTRAGKSARAQLSNIGAISSARVGLNVNTLMEAMSTATKLRRTSRTISEDVQSQAIRKVLSQVESLLRELQSLRKGARQQAELVLIAEELNRLNAEIKVGSKEEAVQPESKILNDEGLTGNSRSESSPNMSSSKDGTTADLLDRMCQLIMLECHKLHSLPALLDRFSSFKSTDPRDKVYALYGLMPSSVRSKLTISYSMPTVDLYTIVALATWSNRNPFQLISYAGIGSRRNFDLPSWVPDWSCIPNATPLTQPYARPSSNYKAFAAGGTTRPQLALEVSECPMVIVQGICVDTIVGLASVLEHDSTSDSDDTLDEYGRAVRKEEYRRRILWHDEAYSLAMETLGERCSEKRIDAFWRTLICNSTKTQRPASAKILRGYQLLVEELDSMRDVCFNEGSSVLIPDEFSKWDDTEELSAMSTYIGRGSIDRRLCATSGGHIGVVPPLSQVGDIVFIASGAATPWVVRRVPGRSNGEGDTTEHTDEYNLVGDCYIHEMMDGEKMDEALIRPLRLK